MEKQERLFWILTLFAVVSSIGSSMITPYLPLFGEEIGMTIGLVGYLVFVNYAVAAVSRIPIGSVSDFLGHGKVIFGGAFCFLLAAAMYVLSSSVPSLLFVGQLFFGLGTSITWVTIPAYITSMRQSVAKYSFSVGMGWLLGPPLGGFIRDNFGMMPLFAVFALCGLALLGLSVWFGKETAGDLEKTTSGAKVRLKESLHTSFKDAVEIFTLHKGVMLAGVSSFVMFMTFAMGASLLPIHFQSIGLLSFQIGRLQSLRTVSSTSIRLAFDLIKRLARKFLGVEDESTLLILSMGLIGVPIMLLPLTSSRPLIMGLLVLWGLSGGLYLPIVLNLIAESTSDGQRGMAMGLRGSMGTLGSALGVLVLSNLAEIYSVQLALKFLGLFTISCAAVLLKLNKSHAYSTERPAVKPGDD